MDVKFNLSNQVRPAYYSLFEYIHFTFIDISICQLENTNRNLFDIFFGTVDLTVQRDEHITDSKCLIDSENHTNCYKKTLNSVSKHKAVF